MRIGHVRLQFILLLYSRFLPILNHNTYLIDSKLALIEPFGLGYRMRKYDVKQAITNWRIRKAS
jgi:hypothetical protein